MYIARSPRMTKMLANSRVFREAPFTLIDVGSLGGVQSFWSAFGVDLRVIAFEPNPDECARLLANADERETFLPYALGSKSGTRRSAYRFADAAQCFSAHYKGGNSLLRRIHETLL